MKNPFLAFTVLLLFLGVFPVEQFGQNPSTQNDPDVTRARILISGKVVLDDGTPLPRSVVVQTTCKGQKRIAAHTDSHGRFSFTIGDPNSVSEAMGGGFEDASVSAKGGMSVGDTPNVAHNLREWRGCGVLAELEGFTSEVVELMARTGDEGGDIGFVTLHRVAPVGALTVSPTSAAAPEPARKALEKAYEQEKNNKWNAAKTSLQKAVQIYPNYAVAWFELGRVQFLQKDREGAIHSFLQSVAIDPKFPSPYLGLMQIASQGQQWKALADVTAKVISLDSAASPEVWFFNGVGNYNLNQLDQAEKSAREGLKLDGGHHFPKLEYLLGIVLEEQKDYAGANEHMQAYLHLISDPREVEGAQKELAEIARLSTMAAAPQASPKN